MSDLTAFLLARTAEDEAAARLADGVTDKREDDWQDVTQPLTVADTLKRESWAKKYGYAYEHIARHDPARVLRECEAKRRIVEEHGWDYADPYESWKGPEYRAKWGDTRDLKNCTRCGGITHHPNLGEVERRDSWPCPTLRALASVYADHPDYDPAWSA